MRLGHIIGVNYAAPLNRGLYHWWMPVAPDAGTANTRVLRDLVYHEDDGTINNPAWSYSVQPHGTLGPALEFSGTNDKVDVSDSGSMNMQQVMTFTAWVHPRSVGGGSNAHMRYIFNDESGGSATCRWSMGSAGNATYDQRIGVNYNDGSNNDTQSTGDIALDAWSHIGTVTDGTNIYFYINGVQDSSAAYTITPTQKGNAWQIGALTTTSREWDGWLTDIAIRLEAFNEHEMLALYEAACQGYPEELLRATKPRRLKSIAAVAGGVPVKEKHYRQMRSA